MHGSCYPFYKHKRSKILSLGRRATAARNLKEFFSRVIVHLFDYDDRISAGAQWCWGLLTSLIPCLRVKDLSKPGQTPTKWHFNVSDWFAVGKWRFSFFNALHCKKPVPWSLLRKISSWLKVLSPVHMRYSLYSLINFVIQFPLGYGRQFSRWKELVSQGSLDPSYRINKWGWVLCRRHFTAEPFFWKSL